MIVNLLDNGSIAGVDPVLPFGQIGSAGGVIKVGNGVSAWSALPTYGYPTPLVYNSLGEVPALPTGTLFYVKGVAQASILQRKNLMTDPKATTTASFATVAAMTQTTINDWLGSAQRFTRNATGAGRVSWFKHALTPLATYSLRFKIRSSEPITGASLLYRPLTSSSSTGQTSIASGLSFPAGESDVIAEGFTLGSTQGNPGSFAFSWSTGSVNATVDFTDFLVEAGATINPFFYSGATTLAAPYSSTWDGAANNSISSLFRTPFAVTPYIA